MQESGPCLLASHLTVLYGGRQNACIISSNIPTASHFSPVTMKRPTALLCVIALLLVSDALAETADVAATPRGAISGQSFGMGYWNVVYPGKVCNPPLIIRCGLNLAFEAASNLLQ